MMDVDPKTLAELIILVKHQEEMIESLKELIDENHQETLEKLSDLAEGGMSFTTTFES